VKELRLERRLRRAGRVLVYVALSVPLGVLGAATILVLVVGAALSVVGIGLPLLLGAAAVARWLAQGDRWAANRLVRTHLPPIPPAPVLRGSPWRRSLDTLSDRQLWRLLALLAVKPPLAIGALVVAIAPLALFAETARLGVQGIGGFGGIEYLGPWRLGPGLGVVLLLLLLPIAVVALAVLDALYSVLCTVARALLSSRSAASGPVREMLAETLGDRSLAIAYWLPDRETFVDEAGRAVELPHPGSGRGWTAVDRDGRRVAAIIHDAALDTGPELVQAAATAAGLAIDNERLKADLRARLEELRESRLRIVQAGDAARRRLERDLHDGAQQHLVSLMLDLRLLKARLGKDSDAAPLVDEVAEKLQIALAELRELARGIHPAILTDRGLEPALRSLGDRVPVDTDIDMAIEERLPAPIEAAAYFLVAEALTNVARYAQASRARVAVRREDADVVVEVTDDGVGGARLGAGSGLRGLEDRLAALDGVLQVESEPGAGTRLTARIPWAGGEGGTDRPPAREAEAEPV
jgi:signal transduction histidine kinase